MNILQMKSILGFTLIELMITLLVAAIVLTVGVPSFQDFIANQRARTVAQDLMAVLLYTRSEAVKRNVNILLSIAKDGNNNLGGWAIISDTSKSYSDCATDPLPGYCLKVQIAQQGNITLTGGDAKIIFQPTGRLSAAVADFNICVPRANQRRIHIDPTGAPMISQTSTVCS